LLNAVEVPAPDTATNAKSDGDHTIEYQLVVDNVMLAQFMPSDDIAPLGVALVETAQNKFRSGDHATLVQLPPAGIVLVFHVIPSADVAA